MTHRQSFIAVAEQVLERLEGGKRVSKTSGGQDGYGCMVPWLKEPFSVSPLRNVLTSVQLNLIRGLVPLLRALHGMLEAKRGAGLRLRLYQSLTVQAAILCYKCGIFSFVQPC